MSHQQTKDLFDESTMSFGEHLEALRIHLIRAILGLAVSIIICLFWGGYVVDFVRAPIDKALAKYSTADIEDDLAGAPEVGIGEWLYYELSLDLIFGDLESRKGKGAGEDEQVAEAEELPRGTLRVEIGKDDLRNALSNVGLTVVDNASEGSVAAESTNADQDDSANKSEGKESETVAILMSSPTFAEMQAVVEQSRRAVTLKVEEAFMTYVQVAVVSGFVLASPWIFYQLWLFVAAGLYPHERRYVHVYGFLSLFLFLTGAAFCFHMVFPFVLKFLLSFNSFLQIQPQIRLSEWINFAIMLPVMFGIAFQLPLVMLFLERLQMVNVELYRTQRKMAILIISIASMFLTPADPMSMILMMVPLVALYELGILLCKWAPAQSPFDQRAAA
ncbi:MAG: twin-arginine translocase subunit TatC [Planctomycetaceae bacterium]|nr:twin-arginine translocase subunit TatC [Planctomycetaceae bacterium]